MVRIDRRSGNRVFDGWPTDEPQAAVIWEAFKPDTEPRRSRRQGQTDQLRELVLAQLRRAQGAGSSARSGADSEGEQQTDFVEESGGIY
jgi:penicillin-binding protein 1A